MGWRRRRLLALGGAGALVVLAVGVIAAVTAVAVDAPTPRERSRALTERPCGRPYVTRALTPVDEPDFGLFPIGRADQPVALAVDPRGTRPTLLAEREGRVLVVDDDGTITDRVALDLVDTSDHGDGGLLALAFDPDDDWLYALRATADQDDVLAAYPLGPDGLPDQAGEVELLRSGHPASEQHHGGGLAFGPDGLLYVGIGDGGGLGDPAGNGQRRDTLLGKILRIDPTPGEAQPYRIPPGNPFADGGGRPEIWATGVRNPYRMSFDEATGDLWLGDVGQSCWEEIDRLEPGDAGAGANLGWDRYEGVAPFEGGAVGDGAVWPLQTYSHLDGWCALVVGYVVHEPALPALDGWLLHTDYCGGRIHGFRPGTGVGDPPRVLDTGLRVQRPVAVAEGPNGLPWVLSLEGEVFEIRPR